MSDPHSAPDLPPQGVMMQLITGRWLSQAIACAAELSVADRMGDAPRDVAELAREVGANEDALNRLLKALAAFGVFTSPEPRRYGLTPVGRTLRADDPHTMRGVARFMGHETMVRTWARLPYSVRENKPAMELVTGLPGFAFMDKDKEMAAVFNEAMVSFSNAELDGILGAYDFSGIGTLADVGGGYGHVLAAILGRYPQMKGILFDMQHAAEGARQLIGDQGLSSRVDLVVGDFFQSGPPACDAVFMKHIIHDWSDEKSVTILKNCAAALRPGGKLLIAEMVEPQAPVPHPSKLLDLEMLAVTDGGRERTEAEFARLFAQGGFRLQRVVPTPGPVSVLEGVRL